MGRTIRKLSNEIISCSKMPQTGISLQQLLEFGSNLSSSKLIHAANFLKTELPIRFAHRVRDLHDLPHGLSNMPSVQLVKEWYIRSFEEIEQFPKVNSASEERKFTELISDIKARHNATLYTMARGVYELKQDMYTTFGTKHDTPRRDIADKYLEQHDLADLGDIHTFLDAFYMSRIGIRTLMAQHIALHEPEPGWVGCICETSSPAEIALAAVDTARHMCIRQYGDVPDVALHGHTDLTMPFIPSHLHHMLFEVIKNSMRAVVEFHGVDNAMPSIRIVIADGEGNEDVCIKISD